MDAASPSSEPSASSICLLTLQPVTSLALICRCLDAADLLAVYKSCKRMSDAVAHPLTFQHELSWRVVPGVGVSVMGPRAVCRGVNELARALASRLFKSFRLLHLGAHGLDLSAALVLLDSPAAPVLHVLSLASTYISLHHLTPALQLPCLRFLRVLCIGAERILPDADGEVVQFPPSIEMLHVEVTAAADKTATAAFGSLLVALPPLQRLRTLVLVPCRGSKTSLRDLVFLQQLEEAVPQLDELHWILPLSLRRLQRELQAAVVEKQAAIPCVRKVTMVQARLVESEEVLDPAELASPNPLLCFPSLTELRLLHDCSKFLLKAPPNFTQRLLDWLPCAKLSSLRSLTLSESTKHQSLGLVDLAPVLASMPQLETISLPHWNVRPEGFALVPKLRSAQITWSPSMRATDPDMGAIFPSIHDLHVRSVEGSALLFSKQLLAIPNLKLLKWNQQPVITPQQLRAQLAKIEAKRVKLIESRSQAASSPDRPSSRATKQKQAEPDLPAQPFVFTAAPMPPSPAVASGSSEPAASSELHPFAAAAQFAPGPAAGMDAASFTLRASSSSFAKAGGKFASKKLPTVKRGGQQGFASSFAAPTAAAAAAAPAVDHAAAPAPALPVYAPAPMILGGVFAPAAAVSGAAFASFASFAGAPLAPLPSFEFGAPAAVTAPAPFAFVAPVEAASAVAATATVDEEVAATSQAGHSKDTDAI